jgi:hypothetical protein
MTTETQPETEHEQEDPVFIPAHIGIDAMNQSDGQLCWRYNGLGRGWTVRFNPETKYYEIAVQANSPQVTDDGLLIEVKTKEHWFLGRMDVEDFWPEKWHARLQPVNIEKTPFPELGEPDDLPKEVRRSHAE